MRKLALLTALASFAVATPAAAATTITFTGQSGSYPGGLSTGGVNFTTFLGTGLAVANYGAQSNGEGLSADNDVNGNYIIGDLSFITDSISIDFGNDDPNFTNAGDLAVLQLFLGGSLVNTVQLALNRDDIMNQTISFSGSSFDRFTFAYTNPLGNPFTGGGAANVGLIEIIDNVTLGAPVPEPGTWAMMLLGFGGIGFAMRRAKRVPNLVQAA